MKIFSPNVRTRKICRLLLWNHVIYYKRQWHVACLTMLLQPIAFLLFACLRTPLNISPKNRTSDIYYHSVTYMEQVIYLRPLKIKKLIGFEEENNLGTKL